MPILYINNILFYKVYIVYKRGNLVRVLVRIEIAKGLLILVKVLLDSRLLVYIYL